MHRRSTTWIIALCLGLLVFIAGSCWYFSRAVPVFLGFTAKTLCSGVFISGRSARDVLRQDIAPVVFFSRLIRANVDPAEKTVTTTLAGLFRKRAFYRNWCGCTLMPVADGSYQINRTPTGLEARRSNLANDVFWPQGTAAAFDTMPAGVNAGKLEAAVSDAFVDTATGRSRQTRAVVVVYRGRLIAERYAKGFHRTMPLAGWSMSKSVTNALVGILVYKGKLNLYDPAAVREWQTPGDPRQKITLDHLLRMTSGLRFREVYTPPSDVTEMLFRSPDFGALAAAKSLEAPPGEKWHYSSGTTNIVTRMIRAAVESEYGHTVSFARRELFNRLGMITATVELDPSGTVVGSSYTFATARDWARFGLLYLQDGIWQGQRILPPGWVQYSRTPTRAAPRGQYGAHFWLNAGTSESPNRRRWPSLPSDMFLAWGFQGQFLIIIPSKDLVLVRLGLNTKSKGWSLEKFVTHITSALP
ncbi:MAG: hypothetical protein AMJ54_09850 [Deltaproteobacteria bacterium SG8_13]|nr:MAG: hypothetical protein AMJ54_09850 [Deltaproteobacteria bacterium SG8_13]